MCNTFPLFKGNISIADCMPLSSLLETIKINSGIKFRWCMKKLRFSTNTWSITAGSSRVITICPVHYSLHHLSRWLSAQQTRSTEASWCPPRFSGSCLRHKPTAICWRQSVQKVPFLTPIWRLLKTSPSTVWDRALPSCTFSRQSTLR